MHTIYFGFMLVFQDIKIRGDKKIRLLYYFLKKLCFVFSIRVLYFLTPQSLNILMSEAKCSVNVLFFNQKQYELVQIQNIV